MLRSIRKIRGWIIPRTTKLQTPILTSASAITIDHQTKIALEILLPIHRMQSLSALGACAIYICQTPETEMSKFATLENFEYISKVLIPVLEQQIVQMRRGVHIKQILLECLLSLQKLNHIALKIPESAPRYGYDSTLTNCGTIRVNCGTIVGSFTVTSSSNYIANTERLRSMRTYNFLFCSCFKYRDHALQVVKPDGTVVKKRNGKPLIFTTKFISGLTPASTDGKPQRFYFDTRIRNKILEFLVEDQYNPLKNVRKIANL